MGKSTVVKGKFILRLSEGSYLTIGDCFKMYSGGHYNPLSRSNSSCICIEPYAQIKIGRNVGLSSVCLWAHKSIVIGDNVKIGANTIVLDSDCHSLNYITRRDNYDQLYKRNKQINISDDVLIGANSIILKGVNIGKRSIVGAGSVVTCDIPSDEIWGGNPAKFIKKTS